MLRIVIADDVQMNRELFEGQLKRQHDVVGSAENGEELVARVLETNPHGIITDFNMPKMNGLEAIQTLRKEGILIPAIIPTGNLLDLYPLGFQECAKSYLSMDEDNSGVYAYADTVPHCYAIWKPYPLKGLHTMIREVVAGTFHQPIA